MLLLSITASVFFGGTIVAAQAPAPQDKKQATPVEVSVELRLRNEFRDNADFKPAQSFLQ